MKNIQIYGKISKKIIASFFAIFLSVGFSSAEQLYSYSEVANQARAGWNKTYRSHGRTIQMNPRIHLPDVNKVPIILAEPHSLVSESSFLKADIDSEQTLNYTENGIAFIGFAKNHPMQTVDSRVGVSFTNIYGPFDDSGCYVEDNNLSFREIQDITAKTFESIGLNDISIDFDTILGYKAYTCRLRYYDAKTDSYTGNAASENGFFLTRVHQRILGIPLMGCVTDTWTGNYMTNFNPYVGYFDIIIQSLNSFSIDGHPLQIKNVILDDAPLCSFNKVIKSFEQKIRSGNIRQASDLYFCYYAWYDSKDHSSYTLIPCWMLYCEYQKKASTVSRFPADEWMLHGEDRVLIVNAQTGKIIDPFSKKKDRINIPTIVEWGK